MFCSKKKKQPPPKNNLWTHKCSQSLCRNRMNTKVPDGSSKTTWSGNSQPPRHVCICAPFHMWIRFKNWTRVCEFYRKKVLKLFHQSASALQRKALSLDLSVCQKWVQTWLLISETFTVSCGIDRSSRRCAINRADEVELLKQLTWFGFSLKVGIDGRQSWVYLQVYMARCGKSIHEWNIRKNIFYHPSFILHRPSLGLPWLYIAPW